MKLEYQSVDGSLWADIIASPVDFDAHPPLHRFRMNWSLGSANVDRTAVASSLIFSPWISGRCDHLRPFSALTEQRIVQWFSQNGVWVTPTPVRAGGLPIPRGSARMWLSGHSPARNDLTLTLVDPDGGSGQIENEIRVASNFTFFKQNAPTGVAEFYIRIGVAILLAESLAVGELVDPDFHAAFPDDFRSAQQLLECVSLGLRNE